MDSILSRRTPEKRNAAYNTRVMAMRKRERLCSRLQGTLSDSTHNSRLLLLRGPRRMDAG